MFDGRFFRRRANGHSISAEKRSVKATKTVEHHQLSHRSLGREEQRRSWQAWQETAHVRKRESQNSEGAEGAVGEGESREEGPKWIDAMKCYSVLILLLGAASARGGRFRSIPYLQVRIHWCPLQRPRPITCRNSTPLLSKNSIPTPSY